jgi:hypothetical protein
MPLQFISAMATAAVSTTPHPLQPLDRGSSRRYQGSASTRLTTSSLPLPPRTISVSGSVAPVPPARSSSAVIPMGMCSLALERPYFLISVRMSSSGRWFRVYLLRWLGHHPQQIWCRHLPLPLQPLHDRLLDAPTRGDAAAYAEHRQGSEYCKS